MKRSKAYLALAERVRAINPEAAEWMMGEEIERMESYAPDATSVWEFSDWSETPQGVAYWINIASDLGETP